MNNDTPADAITQAEASQGQDADFVELRRLYNYADDNSQQFTRWQMASAIAHGRRLGNTRTTSLAAQDGLVYLLKQAVRAAEIHDNGEEWDAVMPMEEWLEKSKAALASIEVKS